MKNFRYVLTYDHIADSVPNSGGPGTTDWTNPVGGIAEFWEYYGEPGATPLIVTSTGFTGDVQQFTKSSSLEQGLQTNFSLKCRSGNAVVLKLKYTSIDEWDIYINDILIDTLPENNSLPVDYEISFIPTSNNLQRLRITQSGDSGSRFRIDELQFQFIPVSSETLTKNPVNWDDLGITFMRNEIYHSVLRSFVLSLRFTKLPGAGGKNIETIYYLDGISAKVSIEIFQRDPQTNDYVSFYTGVIDFNPDRFSIFRDWIEAGVIDSGKMQKFKAREEVNFDLNSEISADNIPITPFGSAPTDIVFTPIDIILNVKQSGNYVDDLIFSLDPGTGNLDPKEIYFFGDIIDINEIGDRLRTEAGPDPLERTAEIYENDTESESVIRFNEVTILDSSSKILFTPFSIGGVWNNHALIYIRLVLQIVDENDVVTSFQFIDQHVFEQTDISLPVSFPIPWDLDNLYLFPYTVPPGSSVRLIATFDPSVGDWFAMDVSIDNNLANRLDFTETSLSIGETFVKCFYPFEAFTRLIQLMTSETNTGKLFRSSYVGRQGGEFTSYPVNGPGALDAISTGWNIRGFPNRAFNVNFRDLFETFFNVHSVGVGYNRVNDYFYLEKLVNFYDSSYFMFDLGEVAELVINPYKEIFDSKINSGYAENGEYEDFQGVNEYNLQSEHSQVLPIKNTKEGRGVYNYDSVGMELARRAQFSLNASKDSKFDENIYIVKTQYSYTEKAGPGVSGFDGINQYYNIKYTPRENLIRNAGLYKSALWNHELRIKFVKAIKDKDINYTNQNGNNVNEFDDITADDLQDPALFVPEVYEFESKLTPEILLILNSNPHGYISFTFDGQRYEGFLSTVESGYYGRKANWKLIAKELTSGDNYVFEDLDNYIFEDGTNYVFD